MNTNGRYQTKSPDVAASVSDLTHDVIELAELQAQLLMFDVKKSSERTRTFLILGVVAICMLLGTIPVALFALAQLLVEQLEWSQAAGLGVATLVGLLICGILGGFAWSCMKEGLISLERSREELNHNITWIKSTLRSRGQATPSTRPISCK